MTAPWWRDAVVYQVYLRSFADTDGNGEGDFEGLRSRLFYLASLGVDAIWLNPFYPSPMRDGGYDIVDYRDVDSRFGTMADFQRLIDDTSSLGIRVITDIVPNHCSSEHPWFRQALVAGPGSPERERFIFRDAPNNWQSSFGGPAWTQAADGQWYLHLFDASQPDFNWRHHDVPVMFEEVLRFWLDRGVSGIRIDMANTLFKDQHLPNQDLASLVAPYYDQPEVHDLYRSWRRILDSYGRDGFPGPRGAIGEIWFTNPDSARPYLSEDELPQLFNLRLLLTPWTARELRAAIDEGRWLTAHSSGSLPWVLGNHDITRVVNRLGVNQDLIRQTTDELRRGRAPVDLKLGTRRARAAALLALALPGSAYIYQGDELGLPEHLNIPAGRRQDPTFYRTDGAAIGRDGCRIPMPWSGHVPPYGFTDNPVRTWLPQPSGWGQLTATAQLADPDSMLNLYRAALRLRREHPALGDGEMTWTEADEDQLAFTRDPGFGFLANLGQKPIAIPASSRIFLSSTPLEGRLLPPDTAAWLEQ